MIHVNLLAVKEIEAEVGKKQELLVAGVCLGGTLLLLGAIAWHQSGQVAALEEKLEGLRKEIVALNLKVREVNDLQKTISELREKRQVLDELEKKRVGPVRIMEGLSSATPARLWLTDFKELGGNLTINGMALDNQTIADFLKALAALPYFKDVELVETLQTDQPGNPLKRFTVKSTLMYYAAPLADAKATPPSTN